MLSGGVETCGKRGGDALVRGKEASWWMGRAEIDTSAPFESVKDAVDLFGGSGRWKPWHRAEQRSFGSESSQEEINVASVEDETAKLQKSLMVKERETLEILKELEITKRVLDGLKLKLHKEETSEHILPLKSTLDSTKVHPITTDYEHEVDKWNVLSSMTSIKPRSPGLILMELKQAKMNLNRTTSGLADIRFSIKSINRELQEEKLALEEVRRRVDLTSMLIPNLDKELGHMRFILQMIKEAETITPKIPPDISRKLHELRSESEQFKRIAEGAKSEALKLSVDIEHTRAGIKTAEVRLSAARKMEAAARASESSATAETKALLNSGDTATGFKHPSGVTLSVEEYNMLVQRAQEAEGLSRKRIEIATAQVEEANKSKSELLKKVDEVKATVRTRKKALNEALLRVEVANKGKLVVEEALRKWRSESGQRRRSIHSSPRFKNSFPGHKRDSKTRDLNGLGLSTSATAADGANKGSTLAPTLSIGQILSRKLVGPEDYENVGNGRESTSARPKLSLGQMLNKRQGISSPETSADGTAPLGLIQPKKKRFSLVRMILSKHKKIQSKSKSRRKKRRQAAPSNAKN